MTKGKDNKSIYCLMFYLCCVIYITLLSRTPNLSRTMLVEPLWSWHEFLTGNWNKGIAIIQNIVLFIPLGILFSSVCQSKWIPIMSCMAITITIELLQYYTCLGLLDIDDIICNAIGGIIGVLLYSIASSYLSVSKTLGVCVIAGIVGCIMAPKQTPDYTRQFFFSVDNVLLYSDTLSISGTCYVYDRESLGYDIALHNDERTIVAKTVREGNHFEAFFVVNPHDTYEVDVHFSGYKSISSQTYVNNGKIGYVNDVPMPSIEGTDIAAILESGSMKYYQAEYDVYVYQVERQLYWLIGKDFDATLIFNLYTNDSDLLPDSRKKYGFDNRSFSKNSVNNITTTMNCGEYYLFSAYLPNEYRITAVKVGMNKGKDVFWEYSFRVDE